MRRSLGLVAGQLVLPGELCLPQPAPQPIESAPDYRGNALIKAQAMSRWAHLPAIADDSGLEVDCLGGRPGVHSARFAGERATDDENLRHLLSVLAGDPGTQQQVARGQATHAPAASRPAIIRTARFVCVIVCCAGDEVLFEARGECSGTIAGAPRGTQGFGYDPVFIPDGHTRTFGEFTPAEKDAISHRGQALAQLAAAIREGRLRLPLEGITA